MSFKTPLSGQEWYSLPLDSSQGGSRISDEAYESMFSTSLTHTATHTALVGDNCPICLEPITPEEVEQDLVYCANVCKKLIHEQCFSLWHFNGAQKKFWCPHCIKSKPMQRIVLKAPPEITKESDESHTTDADDTELFNTQPELTKGSDKSHTIDTNSEEGDVETFCTLALKSVRLRQQEGGYFTGEVPGWDCILAYGESEQECRDDLDSSVRDWVHYRLSEKQKVTLDVTE